MPEGTNVALLDESTGETALSLSMPTGTLKSTGGGDGSTGTLKSTGGVAPDSVSDGVSAT